MGQAPVALSFDHVSAWYWDPTLGARVHVIDCVDWVVRAGETWVLLGANGAGKTTLLRIAGAVTYPSRGTVRVLERRLGATDIDELRAKIGLVDIRDTGRFAPRLTVRQIVQTGATGTIGYFPARIGQAARERTDTLLETLGLARVADQALGTCSQGERARVLVARALVAQPRLLLLDEPSAGIDLPGREALLHTLDRLRADDPTLAIVLTTHHVEEIPTTATHALLLKDRRVFAQGAIGDVLTGGNLSACLDTMLAVTHDEGRWTARAVATQARR